MAYSTTNPPAVITSRVGGGGTAHFVYRSADARTVVEAANYFLNGVALGMKLYDLVDVIVTPTALRTVHAVSSVNASTGAVSISAAVLV